MKKRIVIGYIHSDKKWTIEERIFRKVARENNCEFVMFNLLDEFNEKEIEEKANPCKVIFNNSAEDFAIEFVKTLESLGKKVIDSSRTYYNIEDKWIFYLKCKENKIPVPETILLSENISLAKKELEEFNKWPVVLKRISGTTGDYVDLAHDLNGAEEIIKKFWKKGSERLPVISQEFIKSNCYRVTVIDGKIMQGAMKTGKGWKETGVYASDTSIKKFRIDKNLKKIIKKVVEISYIKVCGIDLLKKQGKWTVLEVNSSPAFDFFPHEREKLIRGVFKVLVKESRGR
jgi:RimK family alpha-L-glutamate ligase